VARDFTVLPDRNSSSHYEGTVVSNTRVVSDAQRRRVRKPCSKSETAFAVNQDIVTED
jgi:hypothetical protein